MKMTRYDSIKGFKEAVEEKLGHFIRPIVWDVILDTLVGYGIHVPCDDKDIDFALTKIKKILSITNENRKGELCPYQEKPVFCQEGICERCFIYENYVR